MFFSVVTSLSVVTHILLLDYYSTTTAQKKTAPEGRLCVLFTHGFYSNYQSKSLSCRFCSK